MSGMWVKSEWRGPLVITLVEAASREAAELAAEEILDIAQLHVPFDPTGRSAPPGELEDSAGTDVEQNRGGGGRYDSGWDASLYYDEPYAVPLHEHPEFVFQGQGEGKWLEKALYQAESQWPAQLAPPLVEVFRLP